MVVLEVDLSVERPNIGSSFSYRKILLRLRCQSESPKTRSTSRDRPNRYQLRSCIISQIPGQYYSLAGHGEQNHRRKLYSILEHRRVILQWIPAHCDIKVNEHVDRLAKQGANMEQEKLLITLKQKQTIINNMFKDEKIPDDYHTLF